MITIITGVPGMGKTAQLVHMLLKNDKLGWNARPVFVMGINGLMLDHANCPPVEEWTEQRPDKDDPTLMLEYFTFPPNSIVVIDEAQRVYRNRSSASKVPPYVQALETHRHTGIDFILLTQKPKQIDSHVLGLSGKHIHIKNTLFGRKLFEWQEFTNVEIKTNYDLAARRSYKPPKEVFSLYKSAELHTKQPTRMHQIWVYLGIALIACGYFTHKIYTRINDKLNPLKTEQITITDSKNTRSLNDKLHQISTPKNTVDQLKPIEALHPYKGFNFQIIASIKSQTKQIYYYRLKSKDATFELNSKHLEELGYNITYVNECSNFLMFEGAAIIATCNDSSTSNGTQSPQNAISGIIKGV